MRLSLPKTIRGLEVKEITAFDCSDTVNDIYDLNFHRRVSFEADRIPSQLDSPRARTRRDIRSKLMRVTIDGLKVKDIDGKADIWTMSPPCQPYTTTRGSKQLDEKDNRTKPFFHLMDLLMEMK